MSLGNAYRRTADLIDSIEASGVRVAAATPTDAAGDDPLTVELTVELPDDVAPSAVEGPVPSGGSGQLAESEADASIEPDTNGTAGETAPATNGHEARLATPASLAEPPTNAIRSDAEVDAASNGSSPTTNGGKGEAGADRASGADVSGDSMVASDDSTDADGGSEPVPCRHDDCDSTFETRHGMKIHFTKTHVGSDAELPAYRDPDRLRDVYETHDTLAEMRDALGADVTVTTLRRHLIDNGIHRSGDDGGTTDESAATADPDQPTSEPEQDGESAAEDAGSDGESAPEPDASTATDGGAEADATPADADTAFDESAEVASGLTVGELRGALHEAATVSGVTQRLDLSTQQTIKLLREYDLLDLVSGRVAEKPDRDSLHAVVDERLADQFDHPRTA